MFDNYRRSLRNENERYIEILKSVVSVSFDELRERYLQFSVYDFDRFSRHDLIGQVVFKGLLECTDLSQEIEYMMDIMCAIQVKNEPLAHRVLWDSVK